MGHHVRLQLGRFYTPIGYEAVMAADNFFYSRSYLKQYGEPFTHAGGLLTWDAGEGLSLAAGLVNGWDKVDAVNERRIGKRAFRHATRCA